MLWVLAMFLMTVWVPPSEGLLAAHVSQTEGNKMYSLTGGNMVKMTGGNMVKKDRWKSGEKGQVEI